MDFPSKNERRMNDIELELEQIQIQIEIQIDDSKDLTYVFSKSEFKGIITHHVQEPTKTNETR